MRTRHAIDHGPELRPDEYRLIREQIYRFCGLTFADDAAYVVERRLRERLNALRLEDFSQYYQMLRYHPDAHTELERAAEALTTNETYFFRERYQLDAFVEAILPELRERAGARKRLIVWSAGCSTGEEVYTLAMLIHRTAQFDGWEVRVVGTDISRRVLNTARRGVYGAASFRAMPQGFDQYFVNTPEGRAIHPTIRAMTHFAHLNLLDTARAALLGRVDVVFCRNVLIYFDDEARSRVVDAFYDRMLPGGYLLLGHSESLLNHVTSLEFIHLRSDLVYRKPELTGTPRPRPGGVR